MIVVDSSAIIAIAQREPEAERLVARIAEDGAPQISAASVLECSIVLRSFRTLPAAAIEAKLDGLLAASGFVVQPVSLEQLVAARLAHIAFGKGTGHPAQLNFGDCFAYALAKSLNAPLLYKGGDFAKTDIVSAV